MDTGFADWRRQIRRSIGWALLVKLVALIALWTFFFSPAHRIEVTPGHVDSRLLIETAPESAND